MIVYLVLGAGFSAMTTMSQGEAPTASARALDSMPIRLVGKVGSGTVERALRARFFEPKPKHKATRAERPFHRQRWL